MSETDQPLSAQEIEALRGKIRELLILPLCEELGARMDAAIRRLIEGKIALTEGAKDKEFKTELFIEHPQNTIYAGVVRAIQ